MKSYKNLYSKIYSFENLYIAFIKAKKKKRHKNGVAEFEYNLEKNLFKIREELKTLSYNPSLPKKFVLKEPKKRTIYVVSFKDRVVHHALCNIVEPIFERSFIFDSYACRKRKGTHRAVWRFDKFRRMVTKNNIQKGYIFKADIRKYFDSVDHKILLQIIGKKIKDEETMWLIEKIVRSYKGKGEFKNKGLPIGNLTSQLFANIYLNELDHFIKEKLKLNTKYYIRYMDDLLLLDSSVDSLLKTKKEISIFLKSQLNLKLHPKKSRVFSIEREVDFLGYQNFYHYKLLRKGALKRINQRLTFLADRYKRGDLSLSTIDNSIMAWLGYAKHADTYNIRKDVLRNLEFLINI